MEIEQAYLLSSPTLRVRRMGDNYILTVKEHVSTLSSTAIHNREEEFALTAEAYAELKAKCGGHTISKTRYRIPYGSYTIELDLFHGRHAGLVIAEVEFPSTAEANLFIPPDWIGADVSADPRYRNLALSIAT